MMLRRGEHTADSATNGSGREHEHEHEPATRNDTGRGNGASSDLREARVDRAIRAMYRDHIEWLDEQQVCALSSLTSVLSGAKREQRYVICCLCSVRSLYPRPMLCCHSSVWLMCRQAVQDDDGLVASSTTGSDSSASRISALTSTPAAGLVPGSLEVRQVVIVGSIPRMRVLPASIHCVSRRGGRPA